ncbi:MAG: hypothetical protein EON92_03490 [Burkholderiales bacterium]|nr:MAG: hypothetical protein EON92_03490 [Burkholderiales bacterium]
MIYVTEATVTADLGAAWAGSATADEIARALLEANTYLAALLEPRWQFLSDEVPAKVKRAGAELAREAIKGTLYPATTREVTSQEVSAAPGTHVKKSFAKGSMASAGAINFARALLAQYLTPAYAYGPVFLERV